MRHHLRRIWRERADSGASKPSLFCLLRYERGWFGKTKAVLFCRRTTSTWLRTMILTARPVVVLTLIGSSTD